MFLHITATIASAWAITETIVCKTLAVKFETLALFAITSFSSCCYLCYSTISFPRLHFHLLFLNLLLTSLFFSLHFCFLYFFFPQPINLQNWLVFFFNLRKYLLRQHSLAHWRNVSPFGLTCSLGNKVQVFFELALISLFCPFLGLEYLGVWTRS